MTFILFAARRVTIQINAGSLTHYKAIMITICENRKLLVIALV